MQLTQAKQLAFKVITSMSPFVVRAEVAGSIRREKPEVKDIEIVAIPLLGESKDLFGEEPENLLYGWARQMGDEGRIQWIKPGTSEIIPWPIKENGRYWRGLLVQTGIKLDLFLTTKKSWGATFLIRTGPADFSARVVSIEARKTGHRFADGKLFDRLSNEVICAEEIDVFNALEMPFVEPKDRQ